MEGCEREERMCRNCGDAKSHVRSKCGSNQPIGRAQDQQWSCDQREQHVLQHVGAEQVVIAYDVYWREQGYEYDQHASGKSGDHPWVYSFVKVVSFSQWTYAKLL